MSKALNLRKVATRKRGKVLGKPRITVIWRNDPPKFQRPSLPYIEYTPPAPQTPQSPIVSGLARFLGFA